MPSRRRSRPVLRLLHRQTDIAQQAIAELNCCPTLPAAYQQAADSAPDQSRRAAAGVPDPAQRRSVQRNIRSHIWHGDSASTREWRASLGLTQR